MARLAVVFAALFMAALVFVPAASAQEALVVTVTSTEGDHVWTRDPAVINGRATLADGQPAVGRVLTVESRPFPYTGPYVAQANVLTGNDGRFTYTGRPVRNLQVRVRGDAGQISQVVTLRVFQAPLDGDLKVLKKKRFRATEISSVPPGYKLSKLYLYICRKNSKRCDYVAKGKGKVTGQQLSASANFKPPKKYRNKKWTVVFRYVPRPGWGDSNASERKKPKKTLSVS